KDASAMTDLRDKHTTLFSILDKGKETLSRIKHSTVTMTSIGKDAVKSNSSFIYLSAKGKDFLGKTQNLFSNGGTALKNTISSGASFLKSQGKDLLSKGSNLFSRTVSKGKDLVSKGKNLLSGHLSKGKDLLKKGNNIVSNTITKGKELGKTVLKSKAFGAVKNFATKGAGVLSAVGAVSDTIDAVSNFKAGNYLDSTGNALGAIGGAVVAVSMFTPVGPVVGTAALVATGASLVIKHRDAIKKGAKKAKDTVVNAA